MKLLTLDAETYWDSDYTLSKMSTEAYVRDPRFHAHMVGLKMDDGPEVIVPHKDIPGVFAKIPWGETAVLCQHSQFDGLILSHHYNVKPAFWFDTLSMFRALYPAEAASLANQCTVLGMPPKGFELMNTKGVERLDPRQFAELAGYCKKDVHLTRRIFDVLKPSFPLSELRLIDLTIRLFTEPVLTLNHTLLEEALEDEKRRIVDLLCKVFPDKQGDIWAAIVNGDTEAMKVIKKPLSSNPQFAQILFNLGIDPPKKLSPAAVKKGIANPEYDLEPPVGIIPPKDPKWAYAFSKTDEAFKHLLNHEDEVISGLVEARLGVKNTIGETRTQRFIGISRRGSWPVYLRYAAAHTLRWGGGDHCNPQNLTRGSKLRESIEAPDGHLLVVRDLSAIEARVNAYISEQNDVVETYRRGEDVYCKMASVVFGRTITKADKDQRFVGKTIVLGCGYGLGWKKFQQMIRIGMLGDSGRVFGEDIAAVLNVHVEGFLYKNAAYVRETLPPNTDEYAHAMHCACAQQIIKTFRDNCPRIVSFWKECQDALDYVCAGEELTLGKNGIVKTCKEGFLLPTGMKIRYVDLDYAMDAKRKEYSILKNSRRGERSKVYGGLCVENIVQRLSRDIIAEHMLRLAPRYRIVMTTHDEIVCCVPEQQAQACYDYMGVVMATPPSWAPDLPLASEGGYAKQYIK